MLIQQILQWLQDSPFIAGIAAAPHLVIVVIEVGHVLGLLLLLTTVLLLSLRLFGSALRKQSLVQLAQAIVPLFWTGLGLTLATGTLLFLSGPLRYYSSPVFVPKLGLLLAALILHALVYRHIVRAPSFRPLLARSSAVLSLTLWFGAALCGRAIGYV